MSAPRPPCPPWCTADHEFLASCTSSGSPFFIGSDLTATMSAYARRYPGAGVEVAVNGKLHLGKPREAEALAVLLEQLADATPGQHRDLAGQVRAAAALLGWKEEG